MTTYPATLPAFQIDGYGYDDDDNLLRTDMDAGPARVRTRSHQGSSVFTVSSVMSYYQMSLFEAFIKYKISGGIDPFEIPLPVGSGIVSHTVRIIGKPSPRAHGARYWAVSMRLEVFERYVISESEYDFFTTEPSAADMINELLNSTTKSTLGAELWG